MNMTRAGAQIVMRLGSLGIRGTYRNIDHHAQPLQPMVALLAAAVEFIPFKTWKQGHNVHALETFDGRVYRFRPIWEKDGRSRDYCGLRMLQVVSGKEIQMVDMRREEDALAVVELLRILARPITGATNARDIWPRH